MDLKRSSRKRNLVPAARQLRREQMPAESVLWQLIRGDRLGYSFRRQHIIGRFVVDFCCPAKKHMIELDGEIHDDPEIREQDEWRTEQLNQFGYSLLRIPNDVVLSDAMTAVALIRKALQSTNRVRGDELT